MLRYQNKDEMIEIVVYQESFKKGCLAAFKSNIPHYFTPDEINDFETFLDQRAIPTNGEMQSTYYYSVLKDNEIVGCGGFGERDRDGKVTLTWGLVHADFHKQGIGKLLLEHRLNEARKIYFSKTIYLDTSQHSAPFFQKHGFKTTKITPDFYMVGLHRYDMEFS